jgi:fructoselysine 6-kinase
MPDFAFATVGDNCIDRFQPPAGLSLVGGNAVNVAVQLSRLGQRAAYFGAVGPDADGARTIAALAAQGVVTDHIRIAPGVTAYTEITIDPSGDRIIGFEEFGVCRVYAPDEAEIARLCRMRHVHFGWMPEAAPLIARLRAAGVSVSKDVSVNPGAAGLSFAFSSAEGQPEAAEAKAAALLAEGAAIAVVTLGEAGSLLADGREVLRTGIRAVPVVDTTGAGDTFIAGFLACRMQGGSLTAALEAGRDAAAETCTFFGGFPQVPDPWPSHRNF